MADEESDYETSEEEEEETESESEEDGEKGKQEEPIPEKALHARKQPISSASPVTSTEKTTEKLARSSENTGHKMSHQRKQNLKSLMLNKARQDLKKEAELKAEEKKNILQSRIEPLADLVGMSEQELKDLCKDLHGKIDKVDELRYDIEQKVRKNDQEIEDLNQRIFDLRGKFKRPPLRRVRMSADQMLRALLGSKHKVSMDLRSNLKSVKKEETKKEEAEVKDWRESVEAKTGMGGKKAVFEGQ